MEELHIEQLSLSERGKYVVAFAKTNVPALKNKVTHLKVLLWLFGIAWFISIIVDTAIGASLNNAFLSNQTDALTAYDQWLQILSGSAMTLAIFGAVAGFHIFFRNKLAWAPRISALIIASAMLISLVFVSASIGYSHIADLLDSLWNGAATLSLDASAQTTNENTSLYLRLTSASLFLGVAFFGALAEIAWFYTKDALLNTESLLVKYQAILSAEAEIKNNISVRQNLLKSLNDLMNRELRVQKTLERLIDSLQKRLNEYEKALPPPINPASVSKPFYDDMTSKRIIIERNINKLTEVLNSPSRLQKLVQLHI